MGSYLKKDKRVLIISIIILISILYIESANSQTLEIPTIKFGLEKATNPGDASVGLQILLLLTILSLAPAILILLTSFTRIIIVLSFMRQALGTQQMPPNQILIGLALFLTFFVMSPTLNDINEKAIKPYMAKEIGLDVGLENAKISIRRFMLRQTRKKDLAMLSSIAKLGKPNNVNDLPLYAIIPAFIISELRIAFQIGFMIYIPFLVVDMVVASVLMSMGMMMLPPIMISLPFKLMLFVLVDGWFLLIGSLVKGFV